MSLVQFKIFLLSIMVLGGFSLMNPVKSWFSVLRKETGIFILIILAFVGIFLTPDPNASIGISEIDPYRFFRIILMVGIAAIVWMLLALKGFRFNKPGASLWWMFVFSIYAMASSLYSVNPLLSLWKGFEVFTIVSLFLYVSSQIRNFDDLNSIIDIFKFIILFLVISSLVGAIIAPGQALIIQRGGIGGVHAYAYRGVFPSIPPNSLAQLGAMVGVTGLVALLYTDRMRNRIMAAGLLILGLAALLLAHSRTSILSFVLAVMFLFVFGKHRFLGLGLAVLAGAILLVIPEFISYGEQYVVRGQTHDAFVTLSGRMNFWPDVLEAFRLSPVIGHGYYAGHRDLVVGGRQLLQYSSVDNTYLEVLVDLGIIGVSILLAAVVSLARNIWFVRPSHFNTKLQSEWRPVWVLLSGLFLIVIIRSLTGPTFQVYHPNLILFLLLGVCVCKARRIKSRVRKPRTPQQM